MKLRPQVQLRFRDVAQFEVLRKSAQSEGLSFNEWILRVLEAKDGRVRDGVSGRVRGEIKKRRQKRNLGGVGRASRKEASRESGAVDRSAQQDSGSKVEKEVRGKSESGKLKPCNVCEAPCIAWGDGRQCTKCKRNWPL
jgi:hypothetical protein